MNNEIKQLRGIRIKGVSFCIVCMLAIWSVSTGASIVLHKDVFSNDYCFVGFMVSEVLFVLSMIAFLFFPRLFLSVITCIANKKIEEQTGCQNAITNAAQNEFAVRAFMNTGEDAAKVACETGEMNPMLEYMQMVDKEVKTSMEFAEKAIRKEWGRKYLNDIVVLISDSKTDKKRELCLRVLYALVYDLAGKYLVSSEDFELRIENMRILVEGIPSKCDRAGLDFCFDHIVSIMRGAYHQDNYKLVIAAYALMQGLQDVKLRSEIRSDVYEMVGASRLYLQEENAISYLKKAIDCRPENLSAIFRLAGHYFSQYDYVHAYEYAGRCFALLPDYEAKKMDLDKIGNMISTVLYVSAFALGHYQEAYATVVAMDERRGRNDATIKGDRAYLAFKCERYDDAENCVKQALELDPSAASALNVKGMLFLRKGMYSNASKAFIAASRYFKPSKKGSMDRYFYGELCNNCAVSLCKNSEQELARGWFDKAISVCYPDVSVDVMDTLPPIAHPVVSK